MRESYLERDASGAPASGSASAREAGEAGEALAGELLAQLLPDANAELLLAGLLAERRAPPQDPSLPAARDSEVTPAARELRRVRTQVALGASARMIQHALNNPLTALLAEAQLLEMELLTDEHRKAAGRMVELARRVVAAARQLALPGAPRPG